MAGGDGNDDMVTAKSVWGIETKGRESVLSRLAGWLNVRLNWAGAQQQMQGRLQAKDPTTYGGCGW